MNDETAKEKEHKRPGLLQRIKQGFSKIGTLNIILMIVGAFFFWFNLQMLDLYRLYGTLPETYACAVVAATIGECGICGWIRTTKDRNQQHKWEQEQNRQDQPQPEEPVNTNAIGFEIPSGTDEPDENDEPCG